MDDFAKKLNQNLRGKNRTLYSEETNVFSFSRQVPTKNPFEGLIFHVFKCENNYPLHLTQHLEENIVPKARSSSDLIV